VPFLRLLSRTLPTTLQLAQNRPEVDQGISHPAGLPDPLGHATQGPQLRGETPSPTPFRCAAATRWRSRRPAVVFLRPIRPPSPCRPWLRQAPYRRLAVWQLTANRRATSACARPCSNNLPISIRPTSRALTSRRRPPVDLRASSCHREGILSQ